MRYEIIQRFSLLNVKFELGMKAVLLRVPRYSVVNGRRIELQNCRCRPKRREVEDRRCITWIVNDQNYMNHSSVSLGITDDSTDLMSHTTCIYMSP